MSDRHGFTDGSAELIDSDEVRRRIATRLREAEIATKLGDEPAKLRSNAA
jgi:hypothetical protein